MMYIRMSCPLGQGCQCASLINPGNGIIDDLAALVIPRSSSVQTLSASSFWMIERGTSSLLVWGGQHHAPKRLTCEMPQMFFSECKRMAMNNWVHLFGKQEASHKNCQSLTVAGGSWWNNTNSCIRHGIQYYIGSCTPCNCRRWIASFPKLLKP